MLDRIRKQKQEKVAVKVPSGPLKVCEKKHGGNAMEGGEDLAGFAARPENWDLAVGIQHEARRYAEALATSKNPFH